MLVSGGGAVGRAGELEHFLGAASLPLNLIGKGALPLGGIEDQAFRAVDQVGDAVHAEVELVAHLNRRRFLIMVISTTMILQWDPREESIR